MVTEGPMVASQWQGVAGELERTTERAPGNESRGGAHPNSGASVGQWGGAAWWRSTTVELARCLPTTRPKSCTTGFEREEGEVGIKEGRIGAG
jgi:hypothetical protein